MINDDEERKNMSSIIRVDILTKTQNWVGLTVVNDRAFKIPCNYMRTSLYCDWMSDLVT